MVFVLARLVFLNDIALTLRESEEPGEATTSVVAMAARAFSSLSRVPTLPVVLFRSINEHTHEMLSAVVRVKEIESVVADRIIIVLSKH